MTALAIIIATVAGLAGLAALTVGLRGRRIDDRPLCRKCRFDLTGVYPGAGESAARCPECGAGLAGPRAVKRGFRRKRPVMIGTGGGLTVFALALAGGVVYVGASGFDVNTIKPVWWLRIEATGERPEVASPAIEEFARRIELGRLSRESVDQLVDRAIEAQLAESSASWREAWGSLVESAIVSGRVDEQRLEQYIKNALNIQLFFQGPGILRHGGPTHHGITTDVVFRFSAGRGPQYSRLIVRPKLLKAWVDEVEVDIRSPEPVDFRLARAGVVMLPMLEVLRLQPGSRHVRAEFHVRTFLGSGKIAGSQHVSANSLTPGGKPPIAEFYFPVEGTIDVVEARDDDSEFDN